MGVVTTPSRCHVVNSTALKTVCVVDAIIIIIVVVVISVVNNKYQGILKKKSQQTICVIRDTEK